MADKITIKETIVVEGKDDKSAVLAAVNANVLTTSGWGLNETNTKLIEDAYRACGIIIFTDPDHAGRETRAKLTALFPDAKQAFLTESEAYKDGDIGIENACSEDIIKALKAACAEISLQGSAACYACEADLVALNLAGSPESAAKRQKVGKSLGIGYGNTKTFVKRLKYFGITLERLKKACEEQGL